MGEYLVHPDYWEIRSTDQPLTPIEALMRADFGEEPEESAMEMDARRELIGGPLDKAMALLDDEERQVIELYFLGKMSLRRIALHVQRPDGSYYGKTWIAHIRDRALAKLRENLSTEMFIPAASGEE